MLGVVSSTGHEVTTTHINPFDLRKPWLKALFDYAECVFEVVRCRFAKCVKVESFDASRELCRELVADDTKARTWRTWVVEVGLYIGIFGVDAYAA